MNPISFKKFTRQFVELSTIHITKKDNELLTHEPAPLITHDLDPGFLIYIPHRRDDDDFWNDLAKSAFSPALKSLLMKVEADGYWFIRLDPDAEEHPELPTFEW
jgi:hypothetical protein